MCRQMLVHNKMDQLLFTPIKNMGYFMLSKLGQPTFFSFSWLTFFSLLHIFLSLLHPIIRWFRPYFSALSIIIWVQILHPHGHNSYSVEEKVWCEAPYSSLWRYLMLLKSCRSRSRITSIGRKGTYFSFVGFSQTTT